VGFVVFLARFSKEMAVFLVGFNYNNTEGNHGCLIHVLSQTSKPPYFNVLHLADFMMHH